MGLISRVSSRTYSEKITKKYVFKESTQGDLEVDDQTAIAIDQKVEAALIADPDHHRNNVMVEENIKNLMDQTSRAVVLAVLVWTPPPKSTLSEQLLKNMAKLKKL